MLQMKHVLFRALVIFFVVPFVITPVLGDAPDQAATSDPLSGLEEDLYSQMEVEILSAPTPLAPVDWQLVYTRTPTFIFSKDPSAIRYRIRVMESGKEIYTYISSGECAANYCSITPPTPLNVAMYQVVSCGTYTWEVQARYADGWQNIYSTPYHFRVLSTGVKSTFNSNTNKWIPYGNWVRVDPGWYKTRGKVSFYSSILNKEGFVDGYVYEVTMRRRGKLTSPDAASPNRLYFNAYPSPLGTDNSWYDGYYFQYRNTGEWSLYVITKGGEPEPIQDWTPSDIISRFGWNTLTVWVKSPEIHLWLNGLYLGSFLEKPGKEKSDFVGVSMFEVDPDVSALLVDSAKLSYSSLPPYPITPTLWP